MTESHGDFLFPAELQGWAKGEHANAIRKYSMDQLKQDVRETLKSREIDSGIWVFGYGSLMWNPDVRHSETEPGLLQGYHRRLCLRSTVYRGTPEQPGVVMGLAPGGNCPGRLFFIPKKHFFPDLLLLWDREMFAGTYLPKWVSVERNPHPIEALTFVANQNHEHYLPPVNLEETALLVSKAKGQRGTNMDYLKNTVEILHQLDLRDAVLERILNLAMMRYSRHPTQ